MRQGEDDLSAWLKVETGEMRLEIGRGWVSPSLEEETFGALNSAEDVVEAIQDLADEVRVAEQVLVVQQVRHAAEQVAQQVTRTALRGDVQADRAGIDRQPEQVQVKPLFEVHVQDGAAVPISLRPSLAVAHTAECRPSKRAGPAQPAPAQHIVEHGRQRA